MFRLWTLGFFAHFLEIESSWKMVLYLVWNDLKLDYFCSLNLHYLIWKAWNTILRIDVRHCFTKQECFSNCDGPHNEGMTYREFVSSSYIADTDCNHVKMIVRNGLFMRLLWLVTLKYWPSWICNSWIIWWYSRCMDCVMVHKSSLTQPTELVATVCLLLKAGN